MCAKRAARTAQLLSRALVKAPVRGRDELRVRAAGGRMLAHQRRQKAAAPFGNQLRRSPGRHFSFSSTPTRAQELKPTPPTRPASGRQINKKIERSGQAKSPRVAQSANQEDRFDPKANPFLDRPKGPQTTGKTQRYSASGRADSKQADDSFGLKGDPSRLASSLN